MPAPFSTALLAFGAILTTVDGLAGVLVAGAGVVIEGITFYFNGNGPGA